MGSKNQRPELWNNLIQEKNKESQLEYFLSKLTELDIWQYIYQEKIEIVPLYYASMRKLVERNGMLIDVNDNRLKILPDENIEEKQVRFRTLDFPLTGAVESNAEV